MATDRLKDVKKAVQQRTRDEIAATGKKNAATVQKQLKLKPRDTAGSKTTKKSRQASR
jgi:hypothetical protein